eukprot:TRINITY_DN8281_c0_g1_i1.p1 TRINITY_DN8281_c0_g1~~TRINITY_DN8281_c0_g1_i1.p1  ORF type:complete len:597 (+),score=59.88 TRINITY_DN8281_c0_g1_i1:327-2117(+)
MNFKQILKCLIGILVALFGFIITVFYDTLMLQDLETRQLKVRVVEAVKPLSGESSFYRDIPPLKLPKNWKSDSCGVGPPPELKGIPPSLQEACAEHIQKMEKICGKDEFGFPGALDEEVGNFEKGVLQRYDGRYHMICHSKPKPGHPLHILTVAGTELYRTCGEVIGKQSVIDIRIEGNRSIEYAFQTEIYRWMKVISFRPVETGTYRIRIRPHLMRQNETEGGGFKFYRSHGGDRFMSTNTCDVRSCRRRKKSFHCKLWQTLLIDVPKDEENCVVPYEKLPECHTSYPTYEDHWFGRWFNECDEEGLNCRHPIDSRPLDALRNQIDNPFLLASVGNCGPTIPHETHKYSRFTYNKAARWGYRPHVCRPRYFTVSKAWDCLSNYALLNVGDSVSSTNGHQLLLWLGVNVTKDFLFSQRGNRTDERLGLLTRKNFSSQAFEYHSIARTLISHLRNVKSEVAAIRTPAQKAIVMFIGLHNAVHQTNHINQKGFRENVLQGMDLSHPFIYNPISGTSIDVACNKKNNDRAWRVNNAIVSEIYNFTSSGVLKPIAVMPSFFMGRSLSWEASSWDAAGTHPFCSFLGLSLWQQAFDLICPA